MKTYLFYDIETSGLNPAFDQILTFACIRCDQNFNEIERDSVTIQLRPDIVPSPQAFIIHRLSHEDLKAGLPEYEACKKIHKIVNKPETVSLGYNTLKFDDEFLRFSFYRNLLDPYTHQYKNRCSRMDIFPLATLFYLFKPEIIEWPYNDGKISFKLEKISNKNSLTVSGRAHEAMADVEATFNLARIFSREQKIYNYAMDFFSKQKDELRISKIENCLNLKGQAFKLGIMVSHRLGPDKNYMALVINIGKSTKYSNQNLWLRLDETDILSFVSNPEESTSLVIRKRYGDLPIILPAKARFYERLTNESVQQAEANLRAISNNIDDFFKIINFHIEFQYLFIPDLDPDAGLYQNGFFNNHEKKDILDFKNANLDGKILVTETMGSERVKILAQRIIQRNYSSKLPEPEQFAEYNELMKKLRSSKTSKAVKGFKNDTKLNCENALKELEETRKLALDGEQKEILDWLQGYIKAMQHGVEAGH